MEPNTPMNREGVRQQLKEAVGRVIYTYTTQNKEANLLRRKNAILKWAQIILTAVSTGGLLAVILQWNQLVLAIISAAFTTAALVVSTYLKAANLEDRIIAHRETANQLWRIREEYISLLTDFDTLDDKTIIEKRDDLTSRTGDIYDKAPQTSPKAYAAAQKALKVEEEQYFSANELDQMLPAHLRSDAGETDTKS